MVLAHFEWLLTPILEVNTCWQIAFTIVFLYVGRVLYNFFFMPFVYHWNDPAMISPAEKSKRQVKAMKRLGGTLPPFPNGWYKVLCSDELRIGEVKHVSALGKEWAVFRTETGKPGLIGTYCPHLGADLSQGKVTGETLSCPFHAFEFKTDGSCAKTPAQDTVPQSLKCQDVLPIKEVNKAIWVWYDVDGNLPTWEVPDLISEEEKSRFKYVGRTHHKVYTHLQEIHENGADINHLAVIHPETILGLKPLWHQWGIVWEPSSEVKHMSNFTVREEMKIRNYTLPGTTFNVTGHHIGPGMVHFDMNSMFGRFRVSQQMLPLEGYLQEAVYQMWTEKSVPLFYAKIVLRAWVQQFEKDIVVWNQKVYLPAPQLVKSDGPIPLYRRWFKQFYSSQGTKKKFDMTDKDLF